MEGDVEGERRWTVPVEGKAPLGSRLDGKMEGGGLVSRKPSIKRRQVEQSWCIGGGGGGCGSVKWCWYSKEDCLSQ